jgi:LTXXQ motif family protein
MSKTRIGIAVVVLATLLPSLALARVRLRIGPLGVARFAVARVLSLGGLHRHGHIRTASLRSQDVRNAMDSELSNPAVRRQIVAAAALAGWHGGHIANGWWRHGDGGYGWVGPLFWPFAIYDIYDYTIWGDGISFWDYGYPDIYAAIFAPYGRDDLAAYTGPSPFGRRHRIVPPLQQLCGDDSREIAGLPINQIQQAIQLDEAQRAALDDLANALVSAAQMIRASCPTQTAFSAPHRLAVMQQRIGAMIQAELGVQQPLGKFYDLLDDEQEARLNALAEDRRKISAANGATEAPAQGCGAAQPAALQWPADEIEARLHPNDAQRAALKVLQDANARAVDILNNACQPKEATTLPIRLDAVDGRLDAMQQAVHLVSAALEDFYATLSDEQKAQFEAIGQKRTA